MFCFLSCHERGTEKKFSESPGGMELRPSDFALRCYTTEPQRLYGERCLLLSSYVTRVLHTARISDVDSLMFVKRIIELIS